MTRLSCKKMLGILCLGLVSTASASAASSVLGKTTISAGADHVTALRLGGALFTWGDNSGSQLGDQSSTDRTTPVYITPNRWLWVDGGANHTLSIKNDSTLWAFGDNAYGQLGNGSTSSLNRPTQIGTDKWIWVSGGFNYSLGIKSDSTLWAWGVNDANQLGDGSGSNQQTPVQIGGDQWLWASAGTSHSLAVMADGTLWAWGNNTRGQLGVRSRVNKTLPTKVGTSTWDHVSAGDSISAGIKSDGTLWTWGKNTLGQLGHGNTTDTTAPVQVGSANWKWVSAGASHMLAIKSDGTLWAWGANTQGQLGDGSTTNRNTPVQIGSSTWIWISAGATHSVGMKSDSTLWAWGDNSNGQLGDSTLVRQLSPKQVTKFSKMTQVISFTRPSDTIYGTSGLTLGATSNSGLTVSYSSGTPSVCSVSGSNLTLNAIGSCAIVATQVGDANYLAATQVQQTFNITKKNLTITGLSASNKVYDNNINATMSGTAALSGVVGSDVVNLDASNASFKFANKNVGNSKTITITGYALSGAASNNYTLSQPSGFSANITTRPITLTANSKTKVYGDNDPTLDWTLSSGTWATGENSGLVVSGQLSRTSGETKGKYVITQGGLVVSSNYALTFVGDTLSITSRPITITADRKTKVYGSADPSLTFTTSEDPGVISGFLYRDTSSQNVGVYAILGDSLVVDSNYAPVTYVPDSMVITAKPLTITADSNSKRYGQSDPTFTWSGSGYAYSDDSTVVSGALARTSGENVGSYALTLGTLASSNYQLSLNTDTLRIVPETLTVTAAAKTKRYGNVDPFLLYTATGFVGSDDEGLLYGVLTRTAGDTVGTYAINAGTLSAGSNYVINYVGDSLTITPRSLTVKAVRKTKIYGAADPSFTYTAIGYGNGDNSSIFSGALERTDTSSAVGTYEISQGTLAANNNYNLTFVPESLAITPKAITLHVDAQTITYGDPDPTFTISGYGGFVGGDDSTIITGSINRAAGTSVGKYLLSQGTLALPANYNLTFVDDTLTINPAALTITAAAKTKVYGAADPTLTWSATGYVNSEDSTVVSGALVRQSGRNVGKYAILQGSLNSSNYTISYTGDSLEITTKALTITAQRKTKIYGSADPTLTWIGSGFAGGENSSAIQGHLYRTAGQGVGVYEIKGDSLVNSNYTITYVPESLAVTPKTLNIVAAPKTKIYGAADPSFTWHGTGYAYTDDSTVVTGNLYRNTSSDNVGKYAIRGDSLSGGTNYTLSYTSDTLTITPKALIVHANAKSKTYGDADPAFDYVADSLVGSDTLQGVLSRESGNNAGKYLIRRGSLNPGANYSMTFVPETLSIAKKTIAIQADSITKVYGSLDPALTWTLSSGSFAYSDDQSAFAGSLLRDTGAHVGSYAIGVGSLSNGNYNFTFTGDSFRITPKALTITANRINKIYGNTDPALTWTAVGYAPGEGPSAILGQLTRAAGQNVGSYLISQGTLNNTDYDITYVADSLAISERPITLHADAKAKLFGSADPSLTWRVSSGSLASWDSLGVVSGALVRDSGNSVRKYAINQGTLAISSNYTLTYVLDSLTISRAPQTLTFANISSKIYGDSVALNATASSGLPVALSVLDTNICQLNGTRVKTRTIGLCQVVAKQVGDTGHLAADSLVRSFSILRKLVVLTPNNLTKTYGTHDSIVPLTYRAVGVVYQDSLRGVLSRETGDTVGAYKILRGTFANASLDSNYTFVFDSTAKLTIVPKALAIRADSQSVIYGNSDPVLTWTGTGYANGDDSTVVTGALTRKTGTIVGSYAISQGTLKANANYTVTFTGDTLRIGKRPLTVTADSKTKVFGAVDPSLTWTATGYKSGETSTVVTGSLVRDTGKVVGKYAIRQGSLNSANYAISFTGDSLQITAKPITVKAAAKTKVYGSADVALTYTATGLNTGDVLTGSLSRQSGDTVGRYLIQQGTLANSNYTISFTGDTLKVTPKPLTVRADSVRINFGDTAVPLSYTVSGLVGSDTLVGLLSRASGDSVGSYLISRGTLADLSNPNYTITYVSSYYKVLPRPIQVVADSSFKYYGTPDSLVNFVYQVTGLLGNDTLSGKLSRVSGEAVGRYAITQGTLANRNYAIQFTGDSLRIGKRDVMVIADAKTKTYSFTDPVFSYKTVGLNRGEVLKGALARTAGERVGKYAILEGTIQTSNPNHNVTFVGDSMAILPKVVNVTAAAKSKDYGSADPALTYTTTGLVGTDALAGALVRDSGQSVGSYAIKKGTLVNRNYTIVYTGANLTINKKSITIKADTGMNKFYGNADPVFTWSGTGYASGDDSSDFTGALGRTTGTNVGRYSLNVGTLSNPNYNVTFVGATFTIKPRALTVTAAARTKIYGDSEPVLTWTGSGYAPGENSTKMSGVLQRAAGTRVGKYLISKGTLTNANYAITFVPETLSITRKSITVNAVKSTKIYKASDPSFSFKATGLVGADLLRGTLSRDTGSAVGPYLIRQGTVGDSLNGNYSITFVPDTFKIVKKALAIAPYAKSKIYGQSDPVFNYKATGLVTGDSLTGALVRDSGANVGTYAIRIGTLANTNYNISLVASALTINPKPIVIKPDSVYKAKNTLDPVIGYSLVSGSTLESGDSLSGALSRVKGELEGKYDINKGTLGHKNYSITLSLYQKKFVIGPDTTNMLGRQQWVKSSSQMNPFIGSPVQMTQVQGWTEILDSKGQIVWSGEIVQFQNWTAPLRFNQGVYWIRNSKSGVFSVRIP